LISTGLRRRSYRKRTTTSTRESSIPSKTIPLFPMTCSKCTFLFFYFFLLTEVVGRNLGIQKSNQMNAHLSPPPLLTPLISSSLDCTAHLSAPDQVRINLMGIAIGNGVIDEPTQVCTPCNLRDITISLRVTSKYFDDVTSTTSSHGSRSRRQ
jgi:hypothetical protein